jgi:hypothetical protein
MANEFEPRVDQWYSLRSRDEMFRVVAVDDGTIEIQSFDGVIEELDPDAWRDLDIEAAEPPENWTGPFDNVDIEDLDDTQSAMRNAGEGSARLEPGFRQNEEWQGARFADGRDEEDEARPAEEYTEDAKPKVKSRTH